MYCKPSIQTEKNEEGLYFIIKCLKSKIVK